MLRERLQRKYQQQGNMRALYAPEEVISSIYLWKFDSALKRFVFTDKELSTTWRILIFGLASWHKGDCQNTHYWCWNIMYRFYGYFLTWIMGSHYNKETDEFYRPGF